MKKYIITIIISIITTLSALFIYNYVKNQNFKNETQSSQTQLKKNEEDTKNALAGKYLLTKEDANKYIELLYENKKFKSYVYDQNQSIDNDKVNNDIEININKDDIYYVDDAEDALSLDNIYCTKDGESIYIYLSLNKGNLFNSIAVDFKGITFELKDNELIQINSTFPFGTASQESYVEGYNLKLIKK